MILLLHGAGGIGPFAFAHLVPPALAGYRLLMPDLPGQGFTRAGITRALGLDADGRGSGAPLSHAEGWQPKLVIGHSAGAALALRLADPGARCAPWSGINAALGQFDGAAGVLFPLLARALAATPFVPSLCQPAVGQRRARCARCSTGTGSPLDAAGLAQYLTLVRDAGPCRRHAGDDGALAARPADGAAAAAGGADASGGQCGRPAVPPTVSRDGRTRCCHGPSCARCRAGPSCA